MLRINKLFLFILIVFVPFTFVVAQSYLPGSEHPRIFLNKETITTLKSRMNANTHEWQLLKQYLDVYMNEDPWGGQYMDGIPSFAIAYLITDNTAYADRAIYFMEKWIDELNAGNPFDVSSDDYGQLYETIGLGFDWLYNYSGFTKSKKDSVIAMMNHVYTFGQTPWDKGGGDFEVDTHDSDQFIGGAKVSSIWGVATYGDNDSAAVMINRARKLWSQTIYNWINNSIGGVWPEGSQYSYNTLYFLFAYTETERTANGLDLWKENPAIKDFPKNVITSLLHLTLPTKDNIVNYNSQEDEDSFYKNRRNHSIATAAFICDNLGFNTEAAYGRYWIKNLFPDNLEMNIWKLFLWYDGNKPATNYLTSNLPNAYFSKGLDWMFLRSDWTEQASFSTFNASWTNVDHQFADGGNFNIFRKGEYLTKQVRHYDFGFMVNNKSQRVDGEASNIVLIKSDYEDDENINSVGSPETFSSEGEAKIIKDKINNSPLFAYSFADLGGSYNRVYDEWGGNSVRVKSYTRQFIQISPDIFFVYDRVRTKDVGWVKYILHSFTEPKVANNLITQKSESGSQYLYNKTLLPQNISIEKINEAQVWTKANGLFDDWMIPESVRKWHVAVKPSDADSINILNVIETADGNAKYINSAKLIESEFVVGGIVGNWLALFAKSEGVNSNIQYSIAENSGTLNNLVCDLESNVNYKLSLDKNYLQTIASDEAGTLYFTIVGTGNITIEKVTTDVDDSKLHVEKFRLSQNYPNPFNPSTTIQFTLPKAEMVSLKIYNTLGKLVATLINKKMNAGLQSVNFDASNLSSGLYFYKIDAGNFVDVKKMLLLK